MDQRTKRSRVVFEVFHLFFVCLFCRVVHRAGQSIRERVAPRVRSSYVFNFRLSFLFLLFPIHLNFEIYRRVIVVIYNP